MRCPKCPGDNNCIGPDGPDDCELLFIGESPGGKEDKAKRVFVGPTGEELTRNYLPLAGLKRSDVRIMNAISCLPPGPKGKLDPKKKAHIELLESCSRHFLIPEIECNSYRLLVPMGNFACRAIGLDISLDLQHGIPINSPCGIAFPMFHPAAGLHEPKKMLQIRTDWIRLRKYLAGKLYIPQDTHGFPEYRVIDGMWESNRDHDCRLPLACDTEVTRKGAPFCLTFSMQPGTGYMIMADNRRCLDEFQDMLDCWHGPILFHNWLFDKEVVIKMGLRFPEKRIVDTMVMAYHLGNVPQGLKALAHRELGMQMQDFYDLVAPYSTKLVLSYYRDAYDIEWPKPEMQLVRQDDGFFKEYKAQGMRTKLKRFFTDYTKDPTKDVFATWDNWEAEHEMIQEKLGEWPGLCITHAPLEEVVTYACRDADATLRLYHRLQHMEKRVRKMPPENWGDV